MTVLLQQVMNGGEGNTQRKEHVVPPVCATHEMLEMEPTSKAVHISVLLFKQRPSSVSSEMTGAQVQAGRAVQSDPASATGGVSRKTLPFQVLD